MQTGRLRLITTFDDLIVANRDEIMSSGRCCIADRWDRGNRITGGSRSSVGRLTLRDQTRLAVLSRNFHLLATCISTAAPF